MIGKIAFKMFLGITADVIAVNEESKSFSLVLKENPFIDFVELPHNMLELKYCNMLVGVIKGVRNFFLSSSFFAFVENDCVDD